MSKKLIDLDGLKKFREEADQKYLIEGEYSPETSVGEADAANNLTPYSDNSGAEEHSPFVFQSSGGDSDVGSLARLRELRGNTVAFNQLVDSETTSVDLISDRKYITDISGVRSLVTGDGSSVNVTGGIDQVFDLTQMFGAGKEPTTVLEFNRLFPEPYYEYNAGELLSCKSNSYKVVGYNQFDEELTINKRYNSTTGELENQNSYCCSTNYIKVIQGQKYTIEASLTGYSFGYLIEYDADNNFIKSNYFADNYTLEQKSFVLSNNTRFVTITLGNSVSSLDDAVVCLHLTYDGTKTGHEPYESKTYSLPNVELRSAGNVYDELKPDGTLIRKVGVVDLGTLGWAYDGVVPGGFGVYLPMGIGSKDNSIKGNAICAKYLTVSHTDRTDKTLTFRFINDSYTGLLGIYDSDYTDAATFKQAMSGVMLYYELVTPTTTQSSPFAENTQIDNWGTQEFIGNGVPQGNGFFYAVDYKAFIDSLGNREDIEFDASQLVTQTQLATSGSFGFKKYTSSAFSQLNSSDITNALIEGAIVSGDLTINSNTLKNPTFFPAVGYVNSNYYGVVMYNPVYGHIAYCLYRKSTNDTASGITIKTNDIIRYSNIGIMNENSSGYGLKLPDTSGFTADKEIATKEDIGFPEITLSSTTLTDLMPFKKGCKIIGSITLGTGGSAVTLNNPVFFPCSLRGDRYLGKVFYTDNGDKGAVIECGYTISSSNILTLYNHNLCSIKMGLAQGSLQLNERSMNYYLNNVYPYASNATTELKFETINDIPIAVDTTFTLATAPTNTYPEYKANITNTDISNAITITLPSGTVVKGNVTISGNTFEIPADSSVELNIQNGRAIVVEW